MAATWLANLGHKIRIIDKRATRVLSGRGDGVHARTLEILDSFKLGDAIRQTGCMLDDMVVWAPDGKGGMQRVSRQPVWGTETSFIKPYTAHQGHIEASFLNGLQQARAPVEVERAVEPIDLEIDKASVGQHDDTSYPVTVTVKHLTRKETPSWPSNAHSILADGSIRDEPSSKHCPSVPNGDYQTKFEGNERAGQTETIRAKYVIGAEGAHSWVRHKLDIRMETASTASTDSLWGVIDVVPKNTDYPDIRRQGPVVSSKHEPIVNVPRENGMNRLYVPLPPDFAEKHSLAVDDPDRTACKVIMERAREAFKPYRLEYQYCDWYTLYKVGRRCASAYGDNDNRIFIAGDACHTHTPKGGQGMNISIQDAHNLGWKLSGVLSGRLRPEILSTYEFERRPIGKNLVELDEQLSSGLSGAAEDREALMKVYGELRKFSDGRAVVYGPGMAVAKQSLQASSCQCEGTAHGIKVGSRVPNHHVRAQATSWLLQTVELMRSDGRWRLLVYGGDISNKSQLDRVNSLGANIARKSGIVDRYKALSSGKPWLEVLLVHSAHLDDASVNSFHEAYRPRDEEHGGTSWLQIFADAPAPLETSRDALGEAHRALGIDQQAGAMALIRPDAFVGWKGGLEEVEALEEYCARILAE